MSLNNYLLYNNNYFIIYFMPTSNTNTFLYSIQLKKSNKKKYICKCYYCYYCYFSKFIKK